MPHDVETWLVDSLREDARREPTASILRNVDRTRYPNLAAVMEQIQDEQAAQAEPPVVEHVHLVVLDPARASRTLGGEPVTPDTCRRIAALYNQEAARLDSSAGSRLMVTDRGALVYDGSPPGPADPVSRLLGVLQDYGTTVDGKSVQPPWTAVAPRRLQRHGHSSSSNGLVARSFEQAMADRRAARSWPGSFFGTILGWVKRL